MAEKTETNPKGAGAPLGHTNSSKNNRIWGNIIRKLAIQEDYKRLHAMAEKLYDKAIIDGDLAAMKEVGDRVDGKVVQQIDQTTEHSGSIAYKWLDSDE